MTSSKQEIFRFSFLIGLFFSLTACVSTTGIYPQSQLLTDKQLDLMPSVADSSTALSWHIQLYQCPDLDELISIAHKGNPTLKLAQARVRQAEAVLAQESALDGPMVEGVIEGKRQRLSAYGMYPAPLAGSVSHLYNTGLNFNYFFDVWGKTKAQVEAALNEKSALQIEAEEAKRILMLSIASQYFQYQALKEDIALLREIVKQYQVLLADYQSQYQAGILLQNEVDEMKIQLLAKQKILDEIEAQALKSKYALAALAGTVAAHLPLLKESMLPKPQLTKLDQLTLNMMGSRADVKAARWRVESYLHRMKAAKKMFYPSVSLSAFAGFNALSFNNWFKHDAYQTSVTPAISLPIFHRGALRANLRYKTAQFDAAIEHYNHTLLSAVQDVASKYTELVQVERNVLYEMSTLEAAKSAHTLLGHRYQAGILSKMHYLNSEIAFIQAKIQLNIAQNQRLQKELAMIEALGGNNK